MEWPDPRLKQLLVQVSTNIVLTSHQPEYQFVERLVDQDTAQTLRAWIKSPDTGFYTIQFSFKKTPQAKRKTAEFNPDFFLWCAAADQVVVVETKADGDVSPLNSGKLDAAVAHFDTLNDMLEDAGEQCRYRFLFLGPSDYDEFFDALRAGELDDYVSGLQGALA